MAAKKNKNIKMLFLDILTDDKKLRRAIHTKVYGGKTYSEATRNAFGLPKERWTYNDVSKGKFPKNLSNFDGVVVGGSTEDPVAGKEKRWVKRSYPFIRQVIKERIPLLGICGGLQFVIRALDGKIIFNPMGREFGNTKIFINTTGKKDPIFQGLPAHIVIQSSHKCMAASLKISWKLLASSRLCRVQAIAIGDRIRLVQFHPEMKGKQIKAIATMRKEALLKEGFIKSEDDFDIFMDSIKNTTSMGRKIIQNFLKYFVLAKL